MYITHTSGDWRYTNQFNVSRHSLRHMADEYTKIRLTGTEKIVLLALIMGIFMTSLDATIVSVAIPTMNEEFGPEIIHTVTDRRNITGTVPVLQDST